MQMLDDFTFYLLVGFVCSFIFVSVLIWRLRSSVRTKVRVHYPGGNEKEFKASEIGRHLVWIQDGELQSAYIPIYVQPGDRNRFGVSDRIYDLVDGDDQAILNPWLTPELDKDDVLFVDSVKELKKRLKETYDDSEIEDMKDKWVVVGVPWRNTNLVSLVVMGDEGFKERYRKRVRAQNTFEQIATGLSKVKWSLLALAWGFGLFVGLYLAPIIASRIGG